ncbi:MAG: GAF domain-containing protein [Alphaproteobacteria bacterium]|nr:GAF domain-containing protein [Alphaproteobacteria bacterium]MDE2112133.1 GAF domain-containing protein [Alphaproteobacteria bacterium]MDE2493931.1 GAF domain-containing protein [Alphaproteobacteria bacterium]
MEKADLYKELEQQARNLLGGERDPIANAANFSALIWEMLPDINWAGFYFRKSGWLVLGPFQGKPACSRLQMGAGVCGTAAAKGKTLVVADVHKFDGHIACDEASNSELVVPLMKYGTVVGVIDLDSPLFNRFDQEDAKGIEALASFWVLASADIP